MLNVSQSLLHLDQYRFGIKSPVLLYSHSLRLHYDSDYSLRFRSQLINQQLNQLNQLHYYDLRLETALCYRHYFCNTELRTAIITKIKGLLIQTQQNTFVLFTLFKLTSDERKTLTKISTCKTSHNHFLKTSARFRHKGTRKPANNQNKEKEKRHFA